MTRGVQGTDPIDACDEVNAPALFIVLAVAAAAVQFGRLLRLLPVGAIDFAQGLMDRFGCNK